MGKVIWEVVVEVRRAGSDGVWERMTFLVEGDRVIEGVILAGSERYEEVRRVMDFWRGQYGGEWDSRFPVSIRTLPSGVS